MYLDPKNLSLGLCIWIQKLLILKKMLEKFDYLGLLQKRNLYINFAYINTFVHDLRNFQ